MSGRLSNEYDIGISVYHSTSLSVRKGDSDMTPAAAACSTEKQVRLPSFPQISIIIVRYNCANKRTDGRTYRVACARLKKAQ